MVVEDPVLKGYNNSFIIISTSLIVVEDPILKGYNNASSEYLFIDFVVEDPILRGYNNTYFSCLRRKKKWYPNW